MQVTNSMLHRGKIGLKPALDDRAVRRNPFVTRQGKFMKEWSCLVTMHERIVTIHDFWASRGQRGEPESVLPVSGLVYSDTLSSGSSIPDLESVSD